MLCADVLLSLVFMIYQTFGREVISVIFRTSVVLMAIGLVILLVDLGYKENKLSDGTCNIAVMPIEGVILPFVGYDDYSLVTTPSQVRDFLKAAEADSDIAGVMFEINSPGGTPVAAEQISQAIRDSKLPTVSLIGDMGASGAYLVAAGANTIIASAMSEVGSIGVTMSYVEESKKNEEDGLTFVPLASGKYKDAGNPNKALTEEERALFEADLKLVHQEFVGQIAKMRNKPVAEIEALADGSAMPGKKALEVGLIDSIGGRAEIKQYFSEKIGIDVSAVNFCDYKVKSLL